MQVILGLDDTRRIDGGGAGETIGILSQIIKERGWGEAAIASRHRLYPNPKVGYKKHNTARSFTVDIHKQYLGSLVECACQIIRDNATPESNSGLAVVIPSKLTESNELINYAYRAKEEIISQEEALYMGSRPGIKVFPLSGNGRGIIGAIGGIGLRMTGNDGQFRGKLRLGSGEGYIATVKEITMETYVEQVKTMNFELLESDERVRMGEKVKVVLQDYKYTLMVFPTDIEYPRWQTSTSNMLRVF